MENESETPEINPRDPGFTVPEALTLTLRRPLQRANKPVLTVLSFRLPTFADLKRHAQDDEELSAKLEKRASLTKTAPPLIEDDREGLLLKLLSTDGLKAEEIAGLLSLDIALAMELIMPYLRLDGVDVENPAVGRRQRAADFEVPESITYRLLRPFAKSASTDEVSQITFRPPTYDESKKIGARHSRDGAIAATEHMMVLLNDDELAAPDIGRMLALDFQLATEKLIPFSRLMPHWAKT